MAMPRAFSRKLERDIRLQAHCPGGGSSNDGLSKLRWIRPLAASLNAGELVAQRRDVSCGEASRDLS